MSVGGGGSLLEVANVKIVLDRGVLFSMSANMW